MKNFSFFLFFMYFLGDVAFASSIARESGVPFEGRPGVHNAITDVQGVEVGMISVISGTAEKRSPGQGAARTGVTVIFPKGRQHALQPVFAGWHAANGAGELTGTTWIEESGLLNGPVVFTNTGSVGTARDGILKWFLK